MLALVFRAKSSISLFKSFLTHNITVKNFSSLKLFKVFVDQAANGDDDNDDNEAFFSTFSDIDIFH
jgi:hypothetical protein